MSSRIALDRTVYAGVLITLLVGIFAGFAHYSDVDSDCILSCPQQPEVGYWLAGLAAVTAYAALFAPRAAPVPGLDRPVNIWRRCAAFLVDVHLLFFVIGAAYMAFQQLMPGLAEAFWISVPASDVSEPDRVGPLGNLLILGVMASYFWLQPLFGRATPGQYIMGYRIENDPDPDVRPRHFYRMIAAYVAASSLHIWGWFVKYEDTIKGNYWWDRIGQTRAVFVGPY